MSSSISDLLPVELLVVIAECDWRAWIGLNATCKGLQKQLTEYKFRWCFIRQIVTDTDYYRYVNWITSDNTIYKFLSIESEGWDGCNITYYFKNIKYKYIEWSRRDDIFYASSIDNYDINGMRTTQCNHNHNNSQVMR
jgi:hypothetical protein